MKKIRRDVLVSTGDACAFKTLLNKLYQVVATTMGRIFCSVKLQRQPTSLFSTHIATSSCVSTPFWLGYCPHWSLSNLSPSVQISEYKPSTRASKDSSQNRRISRGNVTYMQPGVTRAVSARQSRCQPVNRTHHENPAQRIDDKLSFFHLKSSHPSTEPSCKRCTPSSTRQTSFSSSSDRK